MIIFLVVVFSVFVAGAEIDIAIPSFPQMRAFFDITPFMVELVLGINLLFHCIAALFCGGLGDKFGKKRVINIGFILFIIGSGICAITTNFYVLLFGRIIQGIGVAPAMVLSFIIALEHHKDKENIMGIFNGVATISICIAPTIGSYVNLYFGWQGNFWLLFILGIIALVLFQIFIPNDKTYNPAIKIGILQYIALMKNKIIALYVLTLCLTIGAYYTFVGLAPILFIEAFNVKLEYFGMYQGLMTLTFGIFSLVSGKVVQLIGKTKSIFASLFLIFCFCISSLLFVIFDVRNPNLIMGGMLLLSVGVVIPCNAIFVRALEILPEAKGRISALISTMKWVFSVIGIQTASYFYNDSYKSIGIVITFMILFSVLCGKFLINNDKQLYEELVG